MAAQDVSRRDCNAGLLQDLSVFAGLVLAFGLFVFIAICRAPHAPERMASEGEPPTMVPDQETIPAAFVLDLSTKPHEAREAILAKPVTHMPQPDAKPFPTVSMPGKVIAPGFDPAVAEKPSLGMLASAGPEKPVMDRPPRSEGELASALRHSVRIVGLNRTQSHVAVELVRSAKPDRKPPRGPEEVVLALLDNTTKSSLPFAEDSECELEHPQAVALDRFSRLLMERIARAETSAAKHPRSSALSDPRQVLALALKNERKWQSEAAVPAMLQILQVESLPVRLQMVEMLADLGTPEATQALVNRAVFDLAPEIRESANDALGQLYHSGYRQELFEALRYPWPEVAWHAAETFAAVKDTKAVPSLIELLDEPDPRLPSRDETGRMVVKELVGINHVQNCLLCHAPSRSKTDLARRVVSPGGTFSTGGSRYGDSGAIQLDDVAVRADITYLRQDFSVMQQAGQGNFNRSSQRIDYLVWTREATTEEVTQADSDFSEKPPSYPQRDAVLHALRKLTGQNPGTQAEDWRGLEF